MRLSIIKSKPAEQNANTLSIQQRTENWAELLSVSFNLFEVAQHATALAV